MMQEVNHRRGGGGVGMGSADGDDPSSSAAGGVTGVAPGKVAKVRRIKTGTKRPRKKGAKRAAILLWGTVVAILLVSLAVFVGGKVARALGARRRNGRGSSSGSRSRATAAKLTVISGNGGPMVLNPADFAFPSNAASDEREEADRRRPDPTLYRPHDSMEGIGDFSPRYAKLREYIDQLLPDDPERSQRRVDELKTHTFGLMEMVNDASQPQQQPVYDVYNCPDVPPEGYPYQWKLVDMLDRWPTDDPEPRAKVHQGLCVFDYQKDYDKAMAYRNAELPFVTINDPAVLKTVERWSVPGYVESLLGDKPYGCEYTENNHFMYGSGSKPKRKNRRGAAAVEAEPEKKFYAANRHLTLKYSEWLQHAEVPDSELGPDKPHWYYRLITCGKFRGDVCRKNGDNGSEYIMDELTFFQPKKNLYLVDPEAQAGVHCRFGMKGLIAENHWDAGRNTIVVLRGMRRYILAHPKECNNLVLYPKGHPSARHSKMDWAHYDTKTYPEFAQATANEIIMQPGHVLYLPPTWFHYIISLDTNMQCNTRSGNPPDWNKFVRQCGF